MADPSHLNILKQGVDVWNAWRQKHPNIRPDLSGADLSEAKLQKADLSKADLSGANLSTAYLYEADLSKADLSKAKLDNAFLTLANFTEADLSQADLSETDLYRTNFSRAILTDANLTNKKQAEKAYFSKFERSKAKFDDSILTFTHRTQSDLSQAWLPRTTFTRDVLSETTHYRTGFSRANLADTKPTYTISESILSDNIFTGANLTGATFYKEASEEHLEILRKGVDVWNKWREEHPYVRPNLTGANFFEANLTKYNLAKAHFERAFLYKANLSKANLSEANLSKAYLCRADLSGANLANARLSEANLSKAKLSGAILSGANLANARLSEANLSQAWLPRANLTEVALSGANLSSANLSEVDLTDADLSRANLSWADLWRANLSKTNLSVANLTGARLMRATLVETNVENAKFTSCTVYGISVWNLKGEPEEQNNLFITLQAENEPRITVDNLKVAQFIYLLVAYPELNNVIDTITSKVVLILGRFSDERKPTLDAMADLFRQNDYVPVMFEFQKPDSRSFLGTIETLAGMARFVVADFTDAKMVDAEVMKIANTGPLILPVLLASSQEDDNAVLVALRDTSKKILDTYRYEDTASLLASLEEAVIAPANAARAAAIEQDKERSGPIVKAIQEKWPKGLNSSRAA